MPGVGTTWYQYQEAAYHPLSMFFLFFFSIDFIERETGREREREKHQFHLFIQPLVASFNVP